MKKLLLIAVGVAAGYFLGFSDARRHDENVVVRVVNRVGGKTRDAVRTDIDARMEQVEN